MMFNAVYLSVTGTLTCGQVTCALDPPESYCFK